MLNALAPIDLEGKAVALVRYGEPNAPLAAALSARGALLEELLLYERPRMGPMFAALAEHFRRIDESSRGAP